MTARYPLVLNGTAIQELQVGDTVTGIAKADVGLGSVDNTADTAKPVSTAQQTALDLKANLASPAFTGNPTAPTAAQFDNDASIATTAYAMQIGLNAGGTIAYTATATLTAADVGKAIVYFSASAGTLTLPGVSALPVGAIIAISNINAGACTVLRAGASVLLAFGQNTTSIVLQLGDSIILHSNGTNWVQIAGNNGIGAGQTWQDVTASRAASTTYTNSTGKPIAVSVSMISSTPTVIRYTIGALTFAGSASSATGGDNINSAFFIVPNGATYSAYNNVGSSGLLSWFELR
ncbi:MAG: hypothetical protein PHW53_04990 [Patescibacteria group bacterium]|nr:hypothetical protein [Patescibacteria group bacterium]